MSEKIDLVHNLPQNGISEHGVKIIDARSRAKAVDWGFGLLGLTIIAGLVAYIVLDINKLETSTLREWLQTTIASEVGLLAGLLGARERN